MDRGNRGGSRLRLTTVGEPVGEAVGQAGGANLSLRGFEIVLHSPLFHHLAFGVVNAISRAPVAIAGLPDAPGINQIFFPGGEQDLPGGNPAHAVIQDKCGWPMGVSKKAKRAVLVGETGDGIEVVKDISPMAGRIEGGVDKGEVAHLTRKRKIRQPGLVVVGEMLPRPIDGFLG